MTRILALDTATWWGGVALVESGDAGKEPRIVASLGAEVRDSHAARLLGWIDAVLLLADWSPSSLDAFVATRGPGSFTGIRIGLGTVRGMALAAGRPSVGVSTLDAIAEAAGAAPFERIAVMAAGRGEAYGACYRAREPVARPTDGPWLDGATRFLSRRTDHVLIPGPGSEGWLRGLAGPTEVRVGAAPREIAAAAGRIALMRNSLHGETEDRPVPLYLRPPDAEFQPRST